MKLKPCPFCGAQAEHESTVIEEVVRCTMCPVVMMYGGSAVALEAMWNNRCDKEGGGK